MQQIGSDAKNWKKYNHSEKWHQYNSFSTKAMMAFSANSVKFDKQDSRSSIYWICLVT